MMRRVWNPCCCYCNKRVLSCIYITESGYAKKKLHEKKHSVSWFIGLHVNLFFLLLMIISPENHHHQVVTPKSENVDPFIFFLNTLISPNIKLTIKSNNQSIANLCIIIHLLLLSQSTNCNQLGFSVKKNKITNSIRINCLLYLHYD